MSDFIYEHSAGGILLENSKALLIKVTNLQGEIIWTFPKGHLENGETAIDAAIRETAEETGWICKPYVKLYTAHYTFEREGKAVKKDVDWFLMRRICGDGRPTTPDEIMSVKWFPFEEVEKILVYESDIRVFGLAKIAKAKLSQARKI